MSLFGIFKKTEEKQPVKAKQMIETDTPVNLPPNFAQSVMDLEMKLEF